MRDGSRLWIPIAVCVWVTAVIPGPARAGGSYHAGARHRSTRGRAAPPGRGIDFNGDGYADLAVSSLYEDVGAFTAVGAVNVIYGSGAGLTANHAQFWTPASPGMPAGPQSYEQFGFAITSGDFNADGYSDLVVSAPHYDVYGAARSGAVNVIYGGPLGLQAQAPPTQLFTEDTPGINNRLQARSNFGRDLAAGDFNLDGFADLAIGINRETVHRIKQAGTVNVLFGGSAGLTTAASQRWTAASPGVPDVPKYQDWFGRTLFAGDLNGDGYADLGVGVPLKDVSGRRDAGAVDVLYGGPAGLQTADPPAQFWSEDSPGIGGRARPGDYFGRSLAVGDFNADGFGDLAIAVRLKDVNGFRNAGAVNVIYGSSASLAAAGNEYWTEDSPGLPNRAGANDQFGFNLSAADFDGDGYAELAIGAAFKTLGTQHRLVATGALYVLPGTATGLTARGSQFWTQDSPGVLDRSEPGDRFGFSPAADDFNGDGSPDLAIGTDGESFPGFHYAGQCSVLSSVRGVGLQAVSPDDQVWNQGIPGIEPGLQVNDGFGWRAL